jgi:flavin-dependent dehydrogenase
MKLIKILGGGISGLTSAINLKIYGFDVELHEKKSYCGKKHNDFEYLENWTSSQDVLRFIQQINIKNNFYCKPIHTVEILSPSLNKYVGNSKKPFMYLTKRGNGVGSIDSALEQQAKNLGVKIFYQYKPKQEEVDIIAGGPRKIKLITMGIKFPCNREDLASVLLDNTLSKNFYSCFIVNDNIGEIVSCNYANTKNLRDRFDSTILKFKNIYNIKINGIEERFSGGGFITREKSFIPNKAKIDGKYYVGETAGFQDHLAGFGMIYAFKSGYFAAKSIAEKLDYDGLWKKDFGKLIKISLKNRLFFEKLKNENYEKVIKFLNSNNPIIKVLKNNKDILPLLREIYTNSFPRKILNVLLT